MLPSCVPATSFDECAMPLTADFLRPLLEKEGVIGIGEMMNVPGVLSREPEVIENSGYQG
jgi:adenine deaminase